MNGDGCWLYLLRGALALEIGLNGFSRRKQLTIPESRQMEVSGNRVELYVDGESNCDETSNHCHMSLPQAKFNPVPESIKTGTSPL